MDFELNVKYVENSLKVDGPEMKKICEACAEHGVSVSLGFSERDGESVYIAQALIDDSGKLRMTRRKMKPTHMERTVFGDASGDCLAKIVDVPDVGKVGGLSCWEHIQPLLKYYTFSQGEQVHVAAWPPLDPFIQGSPGFYSMSVEGACESLRASSLASNLTRLSQSISIICDRIAVLRPALHQRIDREGHRAVQDSRIPNHGIAGPGCLRYCWTRWSCAQ